MSQNSSEGVRKPVLYVVALVAALAVGAVAVNKMRKSPAETPPEPETADEAAPLAPVVPKPPTATATANPSESGSTPAIPPTLATRRPAPPKPATLAGPAAPPSAEMRSLVSTLANIDLKTAPLTAEAAAAWKENLARLAQSGTAAVPAIHEFLALTNDVNFESVPGGRALLGSSSLRLSLLDALGNISGPEALALSASVLQSTSDPREIALLAQNLERIAPEQYRDAAAAAARSAMAEANAGRLAGKDVGPLFDVLRNFGGADAAQDFQQAAAGQWKYYATIALADLPDGAGVPALTGMVSDPNQAGMGSRVAALQALGQLAGDNAEARGTLMEQARQGTIPAATWINIAASLSGDRFQIGTASTEGNPNLRSWHLAYGNQNYHATPGPLAPDQVQQRLRLIEQLLPLNQNNAIAQAALQDARGKLLARQAPARP